MREVATLEAAAPGTLLGRVEPAGLRTDDPLTWVDRTDNAVACEAEPL